MAIVAALIAIGSRFATKILTTPWAGRRRCCSGASRRPDRWCCYITFGSVIWVALVTDRVPEVRRSCSCSCRCRTDRVAIRVATILGALIVPGVVGLLILSLSPAGERHGRAAVMSIARGYPLTVLLAFLLMVLAALAVCRRQAWPGAGRTPTCRWRQPGA
jgi:hypothetical protein